MKRKRIERARNYSSEVTRPTDELITREQLARRWKCCPHTVARRRDLQPIRLGRRLVRYSLAQVLRIEAEAHGLSGAA